MTKRKGRQALSAFLIAKNKPKGGLPFGLRKSVSMEPMITKERRENDGLTATTAGLPEAAG